MFQLRPANPLLLLLLLFSGPLTIANTVSIQESKKKVAFANPHLLVSTDWLAEHRGDKGVVVVDARSAKDFEGGHVQDAVNISTSDTYDPNARGSIGPAEQIAKLLGSQGISPSTHVVLYDGGKSTAAARVFWTFEVYGHGKVSVLDGGLAKWKHEERDLTKDATKVAAVKYEVGANPGRLSTLDQMMEDLESEEVVMLDARSTGEYDAGRIPAAVRIEWFHNYTSGDVPVFKSPEELLKLYGDQGVTSDKRVHAY